MLEWNVYNEDISRNCIKVYNIFNHGGFYEDCVKNAKKNKDRDSFVDQLECDLQYYFWSRCEYEIVLTAFINPKNNFKDEKIDVFDQIKLNWDIFSEYVWQHANELKST